MCNFLIGYCFDAQVQEAYIVFVERVEEVMYLAVRTSKDTTAVRHRFHIDYLHPQSGKWTSYQEDRRTLVCFTIIDSLRNSLFLDTKDFRCIILFVMIIELPLHCQRPEFVNNAFGKGQNVDV